MNWQNRPRSKFGALAAIRTGEGSPLVLLHGVGLRAEAWSAQIDALAGRFAVTAADMPGHGESALFDDPPTLADYSDRVAEALDEPVFLAGHSMGAMIALDLAIRYPERVCAVAALNAIYRRSAEAAEAVRQRAASLDRVSVADPAGPLARWFGEVESPEATACRDWLTEVSLSGYRAAYTAFAREDGPSDVGLRGLHCPALFLTGSMDPNSTPAMSEAMAAMAPKGRAIVIEGAAHMMPMTHPAQVDGALLDFFEGCDR